MYQSKPKKILVVVESIDIEDSSGSKANVALIYSLYKAGYDLTVYHYTLREIKLEGIRTFAIQENRKSLLFFLSRAERYARDYLKLKLYKPLQNRFGFSFALFNDRNSIVSSLKQLDFKPDFVLTLSKGGSFRPHHALLDLPELHSVWIAYMHDPYPTHHFPFPYNYFEPGYERKELFVKEISERAEYTAFPSLLLKEWMGKYYPGFLKTGVVIPHQIIDIDTSRTVLPEYFNKNEFNILHAGNLLGPRKPAGLVKAFLRFLERIPEARKVTRLIFIGGNNKRVEKTAGKNPNIYCSKEYVNFEQVFALQQQTSINVILEAKAEESPFLPGKFPHCISSDNKILLLGPPKSETRRLLGEDYLYWSEIDDVDKITALIELLYNEWLEKGKLELGRPELYDYLSYRYLKEVVDSIKTKEQ